LPPLVGSLDDLDFGKVSHSEKLYT
jgi:hypothetical protein